MIINITLDGRTLYKDCDVIGKTQENNSTILRFYTEVEVAQKDLFLEFKTPKGEKLSTSKIAPKSEEEGLFEFVVPNSLLTDVGYLEMEIIIRDGNTVFKSFDTTFKILESINATESIPDEFPDFVTEATKILHIIKTDGEGDLFLSNDGTYKDVRYDDTLIKRIISDLSDEVYQHEDQIENLQYNKANQGYVELVEEELKGVEKVVEDIDRDLSNLSNEVEALEQDIQEQESNINHLADTKAEITETGNRIALEIDETKYEITAKLYNKNNVVISTSNKIDLPLESVVVGARYDKDKKEITLILQNGNEVSFSVSDLVSGLVSEDTLNSKLNDYVLKENGKGLSTNDYTTVEKEKLASLENYDDSEIKGDISDLNSKYLENKSKIETLEENKQDTLIPGDNITIENNVISATGGGGGSSVIEGNAKIFTFNIQEMHIYDSDTEAKTKLYMPIIDCLMNDDKKPYILTYNDTNWSSTGEGTMYYYDRWYYDWGYRVFEFKNAFANAYINKEETYSDLNIETDGVFKIYQENNTIPRIEIDTNRRHLKVLEAEQSYDGTFIPENDTDPANKKYVDDITGNLSNLTTEAKDNLVSAINSLDNRIDDIELFKFPNAIIHGIPTINNGQVSGFSNSNYLVLPSTFNLSGRGFEFKFAFTTGNDVSAAQNILGGKYCMALFIQNGKLTLRVSSNGSSWDLVNIEGNANIEPNKTYYVKINFTRLNYVLSISTDDDSYSEIGSVNVGDISPYVSELYIGVGNNFHNPFSGIINLNKCYLKVNQSVIWQGMDDAGLATRLATDMENIDEAGIEKIKEIVNEVITGALEGEY